jgi:Flp pilus assembly protein TadG
MRRLLLHWRCLHADQRGAAAVEFAIISPMFFALLLSVVDIGKYMWTLNTMQYAIDEAVRAGAIQELTDSQIEARVTRALVPISGGSPVTVLAESGSSSVTVTASSTYKFFFPISAIISGADISLRSEMPF